jgi:RNA polymerase sigma-70 factor (sigma-E family)
VHRGPEELDAFRSFVERRSPALVRSAWLLTGREADAQDLVQSALLRTWSRWSTVTRKHEPETYVRRVMMSLFLDGRRRRWSSEVPYDHQAAAGADDPGADHFGAADLRRDVAAALAQLPPGQRATLVLRYFDDLSEASTAAVLGCSIGTVKSQAARALGRLRADPTIQALLPAKGTSA